LLGSCGDWRDVRHSHLHPGARRERWTAENGIMVRQIGLSEDADTGSGFEQCALRFSGRAGKSAPAKRAEHWACGSNHPGNVSNATQ